MTLLGPTGPRAEGSPQAPAPEELLADVRVVRVGLKVPFRGLVEREMALLRGPAGWGEFGPFLEYDDAESARWLAGAVEAAWHGWPAPTRAWVPVNATVPAVPASQVRAVLERYDGCDTAKVKVAEPGQRLADDLDRVAAVREAMGPMARIRLDANGGWDLRQALDAVRRLAAYGLEYVEQPCLAVEDLAALRVELARAGVDVPVAADESIRKAEDPLRVKELRAADLIVVKAMPLGGVRATLAVVAQVGLPAVVSSSLDTSVGIAAGVALAAALPRLDHACGLGTARLLTQDVTDDPLIPRQGRLPAGTAVTVSEDLLARQSVSTARREWWIARIRRCAMLLG